MNVGYHVLLFRSNQICSFSAVNQLLQVRIREMMCIQHNNYYLFQNYHLIKQYYRYSIESFQLLTKSDKCNIIIRFKLL